MSDDKDEIPQIDFTDVERLPARNCTAYRSSEALMVALSIVAIVLSTLFFLYCGQDVLPFRLRSKLHRIPRKIHAS
nr:hypothetical protein [Acidobacteriota bacterium]